MLMLIARIQIEDGVTNSSCRNYYEQRQPKISDETGWHRPGIKRWNTGRNDNHKLARCGRQARCHRKFPIEATEREARRHEESGGLQRYLRFRHRIVFGAVKVSQTLPGWGEFFLFDRR